MASGIQVGDAVLKMFIDWTEIDQIGQNLPAHLKPGTDAAVALGGSFDSVGKSAAAAGTQAAVAGAKIADAGKQAGTGVKAADEATQGLIARIKSLESESVQLQSQVTQLQAKLAALGPGAEPSIRRIGSAFHEAQGEAALLGEVTGVVLPRHVRSFLATLPGVSTALSAAFSVTAIAFIAEAVIALGEKIADYIESEKQIADAWEAASTAGVASLSKLDDGVISAQEKIDNLTHNYLAALKDQLTLIDHASLRELGASIDEFTKNADTSFQKMESYSVWDFFFKGIIPSRYETSSRGTRSIYKGIRRASSGGKSAGSQPTARR